MDLDLDGRNVIVTGGSGGLGTAVLEYLLARGATCHVPVHEPTVSPRFALAAHPNVRATAGVDVGDDAAATAYFASVPRPWASIHLAGGFAAAPLTETSAGDLRAMLDINLVTCFLATREAVRVLRAAGGGRVVNVAARPAVVPTAGMVAYATSKAAVAALTQAAALEAVADGVLINAVLPSIIDTPANRAAMPKADHATWPKASELAATIGSLASPSNALTWGALIPVYGRG